jgi:hypothetical protein
MKVVKQLSLFLENKPGTLSNVCRTLAGNQINVYALSISDGVDHAVMRMVVDDPAKALHILGEHGVLVVERDVLLITCRNQSGELATIARKLAAKKVNIEYVYAATVPEAQTGALIMRVDNIQKARQLLKAH